MEIKSLPHKKYVLVCENEREDGRAACGPVGQNIRERLKEIVKARGLADRIRVSRAGCLDICAAGPNVVVWPEGRWFSRVTEGDLDQIVRYLEVSI